jgi:riboflavin biosynthesis pyrimidine reductase
VKFRLLVGDGPEVVGRKRLAAHYAYPPDGCLRASMVSTVDGATSGADGLSGSISSAPDRVLLSTMRAVSDVVLVGAGTARAEGYRPPRANPAFAGSRAAAGQPPAPVLAVVSGTGDLPQSLRAAGPTTGQVLVISCAAAGSRRLRDLAGELGQTSVIIAGEHRVDPRAAVQALRDRGWRRIVCEGGPGLLGQLVAGGLVEELCVTTTALLAGGGATRLLGDIALPTPVPAHLVHLLHCGTTLFARWRLTPA